MSADLLARLIAAGTPAALVGEVAMALAKAEAAAAAQVEAALAKTKGALRMRRMRERNAASQGVTCDAGDAQVTESVTPPAPSPPPLLSPQTPQTTPPPHPHPGYEIPLARGLAIAAAWGSILIGCEARIRDGAPGKRRWPRDMPPPPAVTDDQWAGFVQHRLAKRQPLTPRAYELLVGKLAKHADDDWPPGRLVDLIVERGWLTFEPDWITRGTEQRNGKRTHYHQRRTSGNGLLDAVFDAEGVGRA